jgi:hypothetical protein
MEHWYTSQKRTSGIWVRCAGGRQVYCGWWWESAEARLYVKRGTVTRSWSPPDASPTALRRLMRELPEIAREIAEQLEPPDG